MQTTWLPSGLRFVLEWVMSVNPLAETASASVGQWSPDALADGAWADAGASEVVPVGCEADSCGAGGCAAADDAALDDAEATEGPPPLPWQPASSTTAITAVTPRKRRFTSPSPYRYMSCPIPIHPPSVRDGRLLLWRLHLPPSAVPFVSDVRFHRSAQRFAWLT